MSEGDNQDQPAEGEAPESEAPAEPTEQPMEIHRPKPIHNWRELASEIGVIVIGILIALGLEQAVETWRARQDARETRSAILTELHGNLIIAATVAKMADCSNRQLHALSDAIGQGDAERTRSLLTRAAFPRPDAWPDFTWQTALSSGTAKHFDEQDRGMFAVFYVSVAIAKAKQERYVNALARLRAIGATGLSSSPEAARAELTELAEMTAALGDLESVAQSFDPLLRVVPGAARYRDQLEVKPTDRNAPPYEQQVAKCRSAAAALQESAR